jgi:hypothetical protein
MYRKNCPPCAGIENVFICAVQLQLLVGNGELRSRPFAQRADRRKERQQPTMPMCRAAVITQEWEVRSAVVAQRPYSATLSELQQKETR